MQVIDIVNEVIRGWNSNCKTSGINVTYILDTKIRVKRYYTTKDKFYEKKIGEIIFRCEGDKNLMLYRKEIEIPKVQHTPQVQVESEIKKSLIQYFLYECIGVFALQCEQVITSKDYAEYDTIKERLKQNPEYEECEITITKDADWYKIGDVFEVFTKQGTIWGVYSALSEFKANNYIGKVHAKHAKITKNPKVKLVSLEDVGIKPKKIILKGE